MSDGVVDIPDFAVLHQDRKRDSHGGVCAYIKEGYCRYKHLKELNCCDEHESLWLHLRPTRLPRGFSCIIAAVIYHPPKSDDRSFREHLFQSLTLVESKYPNCGILVTGDFNRLDIGCLLRHFRLKQIVKEHTRKDATLDLILTNMHYHYSPPPHNLSRHLGCPIIMSWWRLHCTGNASTTPRKPLPSDTYGPALKHQWEDF